MRKILDFPEKAMERKLDEEMLHELINENHILAGALEFYQDAWDSEVSGNSYRVRPSEKLNEDRGNIAREALYCRQARFYSYHCRKIHGFGDK